MCEQCYANTTDLGEVVPEVYLVQATRDGQTMKSGQYGLVRCDDPFCVFSVKPHPEYPSLNITEEVDDAFFDWLADAHKFETALRVSPEIGYWLLNQCKLAGWNEAEGLLAIWLFNRMGLMLVRGDRA